MLTAEEISALVLSLQVAGLALVLSLPFAVAMAYILARKNFPGKIILDGLIHLPLVLPPVATGFVLLILLGRKGPIGGFLYDLLGITLAFRWTGAAIAASIAASGRVTVSLRRSITPVTAPSRRTAAPG